MNKELLINNINFFHSDQKHNNEVQCECEFCLPVYPKNSCSGIAAKNMPYDSMLKKWLLFIQ